MADIIKFEWDQPVEVSLRFAEPKVFASSFPGGDDRHMYSTTDGRVMYVTPLTSARIKALDLAQGECFFVTKRKSGRLTEFAVTREFPEPGSRFGGHKRTYPPQKPNLPERLYYRPELSPEAEATLEQQLQASIEMAQRRKQIAVGQQPNGTFAVPAPRPEAMAVSPAPRCEVATSGVNGNATKSAMPESRLAPAVAEFSARLVLETNALVDSYAVALKAASEKHGNAVKPEDVRALLVTAYINASKQGARNAA
jgi:hypothetical protein